MKYEIGALVTLELSARFTIKAEDADEAEAKAQEIIDKLLVDWKDTPDKQAGVEIEWGEVDQSGEVETCDVL